MKMYTVHRRSRGILVEPDMAFVREGFSWGAAVFGFAWALVHRMWWTALALFVLQAAVAVGLMLVDADTMLQTLATVTVALVVGWAGDEMRRVSLELRGFAPMGVVAARSLEGAEMRFFEKTGLPA